MEVCIVDQVVTHVKAKFGHGDVVDKLYFTTPSDNLSNGRCGYTQLSGCLSQ